ncbi:MAG: hypothetical protein ABIO63_08600 [Casimicrobiaceae bacterium]
MTRLVMDEITRRKLKGINDLVVDTVHAAVDETEKVHNEIARYPYAVLKRITPLATPVRAVEFVQQSVTGLVYRSIRVVTKVAGAAATITLAAVPDDEADGGKRQVSG